MADGKVLWGAVSPRCPDWLLSNSSNVHVAKDREWFTEYTPFSTYLGDCYGLIKDPVEVCGIGTVEIPTKRSPRRTGKDNYGTLRLTNVLHTPRAICNIIGRPIFDDFKVTMTPDKSEKSSGAIRQPNGQTVAYFDGSRSLWLLKLRGYPSAPPLGPRVIQNEGGYIINFHWPEAEAARWNKHQVYQAARGLYPSGGYTAEEKRWLKAHYRSEFYFLREFGLNIYKDEDREEGHEILRMLMRQDSDQSDSDDSSFDCHKADRYFCRNQLYFIRKHYSTSEKFMLTHELNPQDENDCQAAEMLLREIMKYERLRRN